MILRSSNVLLKNNRQISKISKTILFSESLKQIIKSKANKQATEQLLIKVMLQKLLVIRELMVLYSN